MTTIKAAAVQISPVLYSREGTVEKVVEKIIELGRQGVQFATFSEAVVPYYPYFSFVQPPFQMCAEHLRLIEQAVTVPSVATHAIGEASRQTEMVVSIGVNERDGGSLFNAQLLFDADGTLIQRRRKISPTYHERIVWGQGDGSGLRAVDSGVGRIGQDYSRLGFVRHGMILKSAGGAGAGWSRRRARPATRGPRHRAARRSATRSAVPSW